MKSRDTLLRLKKFQAEEKRRSARQIEMMIADFNRMAGELDKEIAGEEQRTRIADPAHFAYSTYARAARARRDNILASVEELAGKLDVARAAMEEAAAELAKAETLDGREKGEKIPDMLRAPQVGAGNLRGVRI